jgi:hypothetical protein
MTMICLPINPENIHDELESIKKLVDYWESRLKKEPLPGIDIPTSNSEEQLECLLRQMTGELLFIAGKCNNLAVILSER